MASRMIHIKLSRTFRNVGVQYNSAADIVLPVKGKLIAGATGASVWYGVI